MIGLGMIGGLLKDHWPKILAAVLVPVLIAIVANYFAKQERAEVRAEEVLVDKGRHEIIVNQQERTLDNVRKANEAERDPTPADVGGMRSKYDRCSASPSSCE